MLCCYFVTNCSLLACSGVAVLEAIEEDQLQQHAHQVGTYLIQQLEALQKVHLPSHDALVTQIAIIEWTHRAG